MPDYTHLMEWMFCGQRFNYMFYTLQLIAILAEKIKYEIMLNVSTWRFFIEIQLISNFIFIEETTSVVVF